MSFCPDRPRLGTLPREVENDSVSSVRLISRTFSLGAVGGAGLTGLGNVVPPALFGRNIKLKPVPAKVPAKLDRTPNVGGATAARGTALLDVDSSLPS